jgi:hypothetical protein
MVIKAIDLTNVLPQFTRGTLLSTIDINVPSPFDTILKIDTVTIVRAEGDLVTLNVNCTGGLAQFEGGEDELNPEALPTYTLTGQLQDVPFSMHIKWKELTNKNKYLLGELLDEVYRYDIPSEELGTYDDETKEFIANRTAYQFNEADAKEFAKRIQQGQTTYQKSSYTWTESTEGTNQLTPPQINKLGKVSEPRGNPPKPAGDRNWMLTNVSQSQSGELYRTNLEWTLSEAGMHDEFLYGD